LKSGCPEPGKATNTLPKELRETFPDTSMRTHGSNESSELRFPSGEDKLSTESPRPKPWFHADNQGALL
jgi:hypothetical protein